MFKFRKLYTKKWQELKGIRVGRLLPPLLTRLQQRYSAYLQRPGLSRLPDAAFQSPVPLAEAEAPTEKVGAVAEVGPAQEVIESQAPVEAPATSEPHAEKPTIKTPTPTPEDPKS